STSASLPSAESPPFASHRQDAPWFFEWLTHPTYDDYWRPWSIDEDYSRIDVPAFHPVGWYDIFLEGTVANFRGLRAGAGSEASRAAQRMVIGPWYHVPWSSRFGDVDFGPQARKTVDAWQVRWFDQFLRGEDTGVLDSPVTAFVMGTNEWRDLAEWPPPDAVPTPLFLRSGGRANTADGDGWLSFEEPGAEPPDQIVSDPLNPTP